MINPKTNHEGWRKCSDSFGNEFWLSPGDSYTKATPQQVTTIEQLQKRIAAMEKAVHDVMAVQLSDKEGDDNLAIALCTYFQDHSDRPEDDEDDDEGWTVWIRARYKDVERRIKEHLMAAGK